MIKKYFKYLSILLLLIALGTMAQAVRDVTPVKPVLNPVNQTLYMVDNSHTPAGILVFAYTGANWNPSYTTIPLPTGEKAYGMAINSTGTKLYISLSPININYQAAVIYYNLDASGVPTGSPVTTSVTWPSGSSPAGMALDESINRLFVADRANGGLVVIDTSTDSFVRFVTYPNASPHFNVAISGGKIYVSNKAASGKIMVYSYSGNADDLAYSTIITGMVYPTYLKVAGDKLYVAVHGNDGVDIIVYNLSDTSSPFGSVLNAAVTTSYGWTAFDVSQDGAYLYYKRALNSAETSNKLYKIKTVDITVNANATEAPVNATINKCDGLVLSFDRAKVALTDSYYGTCQLIPNTTIGPLAPKEIDTSTMKQLDPNNLDAELNQGDTAKGTSVKMTFTVEDPAGATVTPIVRYRITPTGIDWTTVEGTPVPSGSTAAITIPASGGLADGNYEWEAAAKNATGLMTSWADYKGGANVDFKINSLFKIESTSPADAEINVALNQPIVIIFNHAVDKNTFTFNLTPTAGNLSYTWSSGDTRVMVSHSQNFSLSTPYTGTVNAKDTGGKSLTGKNTFSFTTSSDPNHLAPYIVSTVPADGDQNVVLNQPIVINFSLPIDQASFGYTPTPALTNATSTWNASSTQVTINHDNFNASSDYSIEVLATTKSSGPNALPLVPGAANPFAFKTGTTTQPIVYNTGIKRDADTVGSSVTISWQMNPAGSSVDIYTLTCTYDIALDNYSSYYTTDPIKWTNATIGGTINTSYTFQNRVGQGTAEYYKIIPHGTTLKSSDLNKADVLGKFDIAVGPSDTQPNRFFASVPLVPIAPKTSALADVFGTQTTDGDSVLTFNMNKDVIAGSTITGGNWAAFPGVPAVSSIDLGRCYGYLTQTAKFISVIGSLPTTANALNLTGGWDATNDRAAVAEWIAPAYPALVPIANAGLTDATSKGTSPLDSGTIYQFTSNADLISSNDTGMTYDSTTGWLNASGQPATFKLIPGKGFMLNEPKKTAFSWTEPVPY